MQWQPQAVDVSQGVLAAKDRPKGTESRATDKWNKKKKKKWIPPASKQATICHYILIIFGVIVLIICLGSMEPLSDSTFHSKLKWTIKKIISILNKTVVEHCTVGINSNVSHVVYFHQRTINKASPNTKDKISNSVRFCSRQ